MARGARERPESGAGAGPPDGAAEQTPAPSWRKAWPFWLALVIVGVLAIGIGVSYLVRPADERANDSAQVQYAINDYYTARNNVDYGAYRDSMCEADRTASDFPSEAQFSSDVTSSLEENGRVVIPEITDLTISGDRANAKVHWQFDGKSDQQQTTDVVVLREDGDWKVCKA